MLVANGLAVAGFAGDDFAAGVPVGGNPDRDAVRDAVRSVARATAARVTSAFECRVCVDIRHA